MKISDSSDVYQISLSLEEVLVLEEQLSALIVGHGNLQVASEKTAASYN